MQNYLDNFRYVEFLISFQCNYNCSYCFWVNKLKRDYYMFREKGPIAPNTFLRKNIFKILKSLGLFHYTDAFLNYPLEKWEELLAEIFKGKNAYLSFTGGEPLLQWKKLESLIKVVEDVSTSWIIRIDTNGTLSPAIPDKWRNHFSFNISYHTEQIRDQEKFFSNIQELTRGAMSTMINRVVHVESDIENILSEINYFEKRGFFLNIAPADFDLSRWSDKSIQLFEKLINSYDFELKFKGMTKGNLCEYPHFGFQLLPNGYAWVPPCHNVIINLMKTKNPKPLLATESFKCPSSRCVCLHQYSFIKNNPISNRNMASMDILGNYVKAQLNHRNASIK